jgi:hypothetical protein
MDQVHELLYESPTVMVVEIKMGVGILQTSYQDTTDSTIPGFGDVINI